MFSKRFLVGFVVVVVVFGLLVEESMALRARHARFGGRNAAKRSTPVSTGVPTLAPPQGETIASNEPDATLPHPDNRQFRDHTITVRPGSDFEAFSDATPTPHRPFCPAWYADRPEVQPIAAPAASLPIDATTVASWIGISHAPVTFPPELDEAEWLPLGSFALKLTGQRVATRAIQLAVNRHGVIRGNYHDMAADSVREVMGAVDQETLHATWAIGSTGLIVYDIALESLADPEGRLTVRYANGRTATWRMTAMPR